MTEYTKTYGLAEDEEQSAAPLVEVPVAAPAAVEDGEPEIGTRISADSLFPEEESSSEVYGPQTPSESLFPDSGISGIGPVASGEEYGSTLQIQPVGTSSEQSAIQTPPGPRTGMIEAALYHANKGLATGLMLPAFDSALADFHANGDPVKRQQFLDQYKKYEELLKEEHEGVSKFSDILSETAGNIGLQAVPGVAGIMRGASLPARMAFAALIGAQKNVGEGKSPLSAGTMYAAGEAAGTGVAKAGGWVLSKTALPVLAAVLGPRKLSVLKEYAKDSEEIEANKLIQDYEGNPTLQNIVSESQGVGDVLEGTKSAIQLRQRRFDKSVQTARTNAKEQSANIKGVDAVAAANNISEFVGKLKDHVQKRSDEAYDVLELSGASVRSGDLIKALEAEQAKFKGKVGKEDQNAFAALGSYINDIKNVVGAKKVVQIETGKDLFGQPIMVEKEIFDPNVPVAFTQIKDIIKSIDKDGMVNSAYQAANAKDYAAPVAAAARGARSSLDEILKNPNTQVGRDYAKIMKKASRARELHSDLVDKGFGAAEQPAISAILNLGKIQNKVVFDNLMTLDKMTGGKIMPGLRKIIEYNNASKNDSMWRNLPELMVERDRAIMALKNDVMAISSQNPQLAAMIIDEIDQKSSGQIVEETIDEIMRGFNDKFGSSISLAKNPEGALRQLMFRRPGEKIVPQQQVSRLSELAGRSSGEYQRSVDDFAILRAFKGEATAGSQGVNAANMILNKALPQPVIALFGLMRDAFGPQGTRWIIRATAENGMVRARMRSIGIPLAIRTTLTGHYGEDVKDFVIKKGTPEYESFMQTIKADKSVSPVQKLKIMRAAEDGISIPDIWKDMSPAPAQQFPGGPAIDQLVKTMGG